MTETQIDINEDVDVLDNGYDHLMLLELEDNYGRSRRTVRQSALEELWTKLKAIGYVWSDLDHALGCDCDYMKRYNAS